MQPSVSKVRIVVRVGSKSQVYGDLYRHLSPSTVGEVLRRLPLEGRVSRYNDLFVYITSPIVVGAEKSRLSFKRGEIALLPSNGGICFFLKDCGVARHMNPLGRMASDLGVLEGLKPGDTLTISKAPQEVTEKT